MMEEEMMGDESKQNDRSESAFSGTNNGTERIHVRQETKRVDEEWKNVGGNGSLVSWHDGLAEKVVAGAIPYNRSFALYVPKRLIPRHGDSDDVFEIRVARESGIGVELPFYAKHRLTDRRIVLSLFQLETRHRERFLLLKVTKYDLESFIHDFNASQVRGLEGTKLVSDKTGLGLKIDRVDLPLTRAELNCFQGEATLDVKLGGTCPIKFRKGIWGFRLRLKHPGQQITSLEARDDAVLVRYRSNDGVRGESLRILDLARRPLGTLRSASESAEIRLISRPEAFQGDFVVEFPSRLEKDVRDRLRNVSGRGEHTTAKGELAEALVNLILSKVGCPEIANHPRGKTNGYRASERKGPDSLRWVPGVGKAYFEIKWWSQFNMAVWDGRKMIRKYCREMPEPDGRRVENGYVAVLDWDVGKLTARLYVEKVV
jgi:hypothetical protein